MNMKAIKKTVLMLALATITLSNANASASVRLGFRKSISSVEDISYKEQLKYYYGQGSYEIVDSNDKITVSSNEAYYEYCMYEGKLSQQRIFDSEGEQISDIYLNYDEGNLTFVEDAGDFSYSISYSDEQVKQASFNENVQYENSYDEQGNLSEKKYSNGGSIKYAYDSDGYVTDMDCGDSKYRYDRTYESADDYSVVVTDSIDETSVTYDYGDGELYSLSGKDHQIYYSYDDDENAIKEYSFEGNYHSIIESSDSIEFDSIKQSYLKDEYGRVIKTTTDLWNDIELTEICEYDDSGRILSFSFDDNSFKYEYENEKILETSSPFGKSTYSYDTKSRLVEEATDGIDISYAYDSHGNLVEKEYLGGYATICMSYDDLGRLTDRNGETIEYDEIGNPLNYMGFQLSWTRGSLLSSLERVGRTIEYSYDDNGFRTSKSVDGETVEYVNDEKAYTIFERTEDYLVYFMRGKEGQLIGFTLDRGGESESYFYIKDGLGNIVGIMDSSKNVIAEYRYDSFGNILNYDELRRNEIGMINPYRYRGYRYDNETGFYYLGTRYYDPTITRFISPDDIANIERYSIGTDINLYSYCSSDPINSVDGDGRFAIAIFGVSMSLGSIILLSAFVAIAFFATVFPKQFQATCSAAFSNLVDFFDACMKAKTTFWEKILRSGKIHVHHIVPKALKGAEPARQVLKSAKIEPLTDTRNLVELKARFHLKLHTTFYVNCINALFIKAQKNGDNAVINTLFCMKVLLASINIFQ